MNQEIKSTRKLLGAIAAAVCLMFVAVIAMAAFPNPSSTHNPDNSARKPVRLVVHGVGFDKNGRLTDGSKAVLDDAAEMLKQQPNATVSVDQKRAADPNAACGLSPDQTEKIARYIEQRGVPATHLMLCEAMPPSAPSAPPLQE